MKNKAAILALLALVSISVLPFLNVMRYAPMPDWGSNASALTLVVMAALAAMDLSHRQEDRIWHVAPFIGLAAMWWVLVFLPFGVLHEGLLPISEMSAVLMAIFAAALMSTVCRLLPRESIVLVLALAMLAGGIIQSLIATLQLLQLAHLADGWLMYSAQHDVIGNIAQRNQLAHILTWASLATMYCWTSGRISFWIMLMLTGWLAMVTAWSGGRLPVAYALAFLSFALVFCMDRRSRRLAAGLAILAVIMLLMQWLAPYMAELLTGKATSSGLFRLTGEDFGIRRRIEWQKAWLLAQHFPWFGVGFGEWGYYSTWLEAFGGLNKAPESSLFTHSHNLVFQLLAETGWPATLFAAGVVVFCLWPYLSARNRTPENVFLLMLAVVILVHSMFEYPLWYLPFLIIFFFVLVLSPHPDAELEIRPAMRKFAAFLLTAGASIYLLTAYPAYKDILLSQSPSRDAAVNAANVDRIMSAARNPFFLFESELALSNYLTPSRSDVKIKLQHYEELVRYRPYPSLLTNLAILRAFNGDASGAERAMRMAIAAYPDSLATMILVLSQYQEPHMQPLQTMAVKAFRVYQQQGGSKAAQSVSSQHLQLPLPAE